MHSNNDGMPDDWKPTPSDPFENFMNDKKIAYMQNNAGTFNTVHVTEWAHEYARKLERELTAEKQKAQKLVEALQIYANRVCEFTDDGGRVFYKNGSDNPPALPFYSGEQWELGHHAEKALADYSTDSGDGVG